MRFLFFFLLIPFLPAAQNLLVNGGFEEENICSEYKVNCAPEGWLYTIPSFLYYFKNEEGAHTGNHYIGLIAGHRQKPMYRTFVRSRLLCGLRKDKSYRISFYIRSPYPVLDSIGVYFSSYDFLFEKTPYPQLRASFYMTNAMAKPRRGDTTWQKITYLYKANGTETFITLGNFKKLDINARPGFRLENNFLVYFDDINIEPTDPQEKLCRNWKKTREDIYSEDERHEYQEMKMRVQKKKPITPLISTPTRMVTIDTLVIPDIFFATNSYQLDKKALLVLDSFVRRRSAYMFDSVIVEGHTDNLGSRQWNEQLSMNRAKAVGVYLEYFMNTAVITRGWADTRPIADNNSPGGRRKNRRVEIYLYIRD